MEIHIGLLCGKCEVTEIKVSSLLGRCATYKKKYGDNSISNVKKMTFRNRYSCQINTISCDHVYCPECSYLKGKCYICGADIKEGK